MSVAITRREVIASVPGAGILAVLFQSMPSTAVSAGESPSTVPQSLWPEFPRQNPNLAREIVGVSHSNEKRVRELIELHPSLVNASWDWGFGDWETALGAASHTGRRSIAEFLIERGARVDIFAAAMLGQTDVVQAMVAASPGIQRTLGPHCIPLLAHAEAGGEKAKETLAYLESLGDAGRTPPVQTVSNEQRELYLGRYQYGENPNEILEVKLNQDRLAIVAGDGASRMLNCVGTHEFFPSGVPSVRIRFAVEEGRVTALTVLDPVPLVEARRLAG